MTPIDPEAQPRPAHQALEVPTPPSAPPCSRPTRDRGDDLAPWRGALWAVPFSILGWLLVIALVVALRH